MVAVIQSDDDGGVKAAKIPKACPALHGVSPNRPSATARPVPFVIDALKTLRARNLSLNLIDVFDFKTGNGVGHTMASNATVPTWLQMGKHTGHPLTTALILASTASPACPLLYP